MSETAKDDAAAAVGDLGAGEAEARAADDGAAASGAGGDFDDGAPPPGYAGEYGFKGARADAGAAPRANPAPGLAAALRDFCAAASAVFGESVTDALRDDRPRAVIVRARTIWAVFAAGAALGACAAGLAAAAGFILAMGA